MRISGSGFGMIRFTNSWCCGTGLFGSRSYGQFPLILFTIVVALMKFCLHGHQHQWGSWGKSSVTDPKLTKLPKMHHQHREIYSEYISKSDPASCFTLQWDLWLVWHKCDFKLETIQRRYLLTIHAMNNVSMAWLDGGNFLYQALQICRPTYWAMRTSSAPLAPQKVCLPGGCFEPRVCCGWAPNCSTYDLVMPSCKWDQLLVKIFTSASFKWSVLCASQ